MRIAVLHFSHETVTFLPNDTTLADFTYPGSPVSGEALLASGPRSYMGGFVKVAREHQGVELVGIESPLWPITGTGSGWITADAYETFVARMVAELHAARPFDGAYLCLHGAMAVRGVPRPEADLARRVRTALGPRAVIAATFDPHGNEDETFLHHADLAFTVKYFPHYDDHLQGERAARTLVRAINGDYRPTHRTIDVPILAPTVMMWTGASPWMDLAQRALVWEARTPDAYVNVFFGFPWADVPDAGMTVQAITNGDQPLADRIAQDMQAWVWRHRAALVNAAEVHSIGAGVALAKEAVARGDTPVVLADHSDRSGAATWLLREIVGQGLTHTLVATIADAEAVATLQAAGVGATVALDVGGRIDPSAGDPIHLAGQVLRVGQGPGGLTATIGFGDGNALVVSPHLVQVIELETLQALGLDPAAFQVIAIKSRVHFRRGFHDTGFAPTILLVEPDEPFLGTTRLDALPYQNLDPTRFYPYAKEP